ncbi:hypothetical protein H5410_011344 [Solanum commersonii]|uniref:Cyclin-like domain-containing protein n=1 Tax=Solanum commersonii TaxID=4109 RepID=A0A9J6ANE1_SOLCO|nr:hypothetical protein H5410_011344 [Solanum commersonii]
MADFMTSTHKTKWIYTPQDIKHKYKVANQRAKQALEMNIGLIYSACGFMNNSIILIANSIVKFGTTRMEVDIDGTFSYAESQNDAKDNAEKRPKPLKVEEEQLLRAFYEFKIQDVCDAFKFPRKIQATALIYFKRFYLLWSVMEHHPKDIMLTCIYAACKAEENHVSAEELGKGIGQDHHVILNNEMLVFQAWILFKGYFILHFPLNLALINFFITFLLQSLGFDLIAYAPYRALEGFISDLEEFCGAQDDDQLVALKVIVISFRQEKVVQMKSPSTLSLRIQVTKGSKWRKRATIDSWEGVSGGADGALDTARIEADKIMRSDGPLLFPPGQLALAALHRANAAHGIFDFERYLRSVLSHHDQPGHAISELTGSINAIDSLAILLHPELPAFEQIGKLLTPTSKDVKHIDRKLKSCLDPGSHDKSKKRKHRSKDSSNEVTDIS